MECLQLLPGVKSFQVCLRVSELTNVVTWTEANVVWVVVILGGFTLFFALWGSQRIDVPTKQLVGLSPKELAEMLLCESITPEQYQHLLNCGYLELPSRLFPNRTYRIPRERRRVQVFETDETSIDQQPQKIGELCVIACEPMPDADLVLTHKWLIEADEQRYLHTANWVR